MRHCVILLLLLGYHTNGQNILIKRDGECIPFKKIKFFYEEVDIVTEDKGKIPIKVDDILAFYDEKDETIFYKKRALVAEDDGKEGRSYSFSEKITEGKITLYRVVVTRMDYGVVVTRMGGPNGQNVNFDFYHAEKGAQMKSVFRAKILKNNKNDLKVLRALLQDQPDVLKRIDDENFRYDESSLISVIRDYNIRSLPKIDSSVQQTQREVNFYVQEKVSSKGVVSLKVNDTAEYTLNSNQPVSVKLATTASSKVCFTVGNETTCEVLKPAAIPDIYYEIVYTNTNDGVFGYKAFEIKQKVKSK